MTGAGRLLGGALWASAGQVAQAALALGGLVILVRLLGAETYGVFAFGLLLTGLADVLVGGQSAEVLVQRRTVDRTTERAAFTVILAVSVAAAAGIAALAGPAAAFFETPELAAILPVMAALPLLTGLGAVPSQLLVRAFRFDALAKSTTAAAVAATVAGILLAFAGAGVWSLVGMEIVRRVVTLALVLAASGFRPGLSLSRPAIAEVVAFARRRVENQLLVHISQNALPRLFVGEALGAAALGTFTIARRLLDQIHGILSGPAAAVAFPAVARERDDLPRVRRMIAAAIRLTTWTYWPAVLGLIVVAPVLLPLAFGPEWAAAVPMLQVLAIGSLRVPLSAFNTAVLVGFGRLRWVTFISLLAIPVGVVALTVGVEFGLVGAAAALALRQWLMWPVGATLVARLTGFPVSEQLAVASRSAVPAVVMAAVVALIAARGEPFAPVAELALLVAAGIGVYGIAWAATYPGRAMGAVRGVVALLGGDRAAAKASIRAAVR